MRSGRLLAEDNPRILTRNMREPSLEGAFLRLCKEDKNMMLMPTTTNGASDKSSNLSEKEHQQHQNVLREGEDQMDSSSRSTLLLIQDTIDSILAKKTRCVKPKKKIRKLTSRATKIRTLFSKHLMLRRRNLGMMLFIFLVPAVIVTVFYICIGHIPFDLHLAVVNEEKPALMSQQFLNKINNHAINQKIYEDLSSAKLSVERGHNWGVLYVGENFSQSLLDKYQYFPIVDDATINASTVRLFLDMTSPIIGYIIEKNILEAFLAFEKDSPKLSGSMAAISNVPISFGDPIYGKLNPDFTEFLAPGVIISGIYFLAMAMTTNELLEEKVKGIFERCWVAGVTLPEVLLSRFLEQLLVLTIQIFGVMIIAFLFFETPSSGPAVLMVSLLFLQGISGMTCGFFISSICESKVSAMMTIIGFFHLNLFMSGMWPVEGMSQILRMIGNCMPQTTAIATARDILLRGWNLLNTFVWSGFLATLGWTIFFLLISILIFSRRL